MCTRRVMALQPFVGSSHRATTPTAGTVAGARAFLRIAVFASLLGKICSSLDAADSRRTFEEHRARDKQGAEMVRQDVRDQWAACPPKHRKAVMFSLDNRGDRWNVTRLHLLSTGVCPARIAACGHKDVVRLASDHCNRSEQIATESRCKVSPMALNGSLYTCHGRIIAGVCGFCLDVLAQDCLSIKGVRNTRFMTTNSAVCTVARSVVFWSYTALQYPPQRMMPRALHRAVMLEYGTWVPCTCLFRLFVRVFNCFFCFLVCALFFWWGGSARCTTGMSAIMYSTV